jgi:hypothetical protein
MSLIRKILVGLLCTALARGIILAFGLDKDIAALIRAAMSPQSREAVAWILSGTIGLIGLFLWETRPTWLRLRGQIRPDMRINDAIDYIVNDSTEKLKQPGPPRKIEYGHAAGGTMIEVGVQHEDARRILNNELISGNLRCWGKRQILGRHPIQFETSAREIDNSCWDNLYLHYVRALYYIETEAQTEVLPGRTAEHQWTALMISHIQIHQIWRRKSLARRLTERARRRQRIKPHPNW